MLIVMSSSVLGHQPFYNYFSKPPPKDLGLDGRQGMAPIVSNTSERGIDIGLTELRHPQHLNHQHIKHFQDLHQQAVSRQNRYSAGPEHPNTYNNLSTEPKEQPRKVITSSTTTLPSVSSAVEFSTSSGHEFGRRSAGSRRIFKVMNLESSRGKKIFSTLLTTIGIFGVIIGFLVAFGIGYQRWTTMGMLSYDSFLKDDHITYDILRNIKIRNLRNHLDYFVEKPHLTGQKRDRDISIFIAKSFKHLGLDVFVPRYNVLLSFPNFNENGEWVDGEDANNEVRIIIKSDTNDKDITYDWPSNERYSVAADSNRENNYPVENELNHINVEDMIPHPFPNKQSLKDNKIAPAFSAYSPRNVKESSSGLLPSRIPDNQKHVMFLNYGRIEDYEALFSENEGKDVKNALSGDVVIVRYGKISASEKARNAEYYNAKGLLLYEDSPSGPNSDNEKGTRRSSLLPYQFGDIMSPGWPSDFKDGATVVTEEDAESKVGTNFGTEQLIGINKTITNNLGALTGSNFGEVLPLIPVQPISKKAARDILKNLEDGVLKVPDDWKREMLLGSRNYKIGGTAKVKVGITIANQLNITTISNVIGMIPGAIEPDRYVIVGSHRDSWSRGAIDPSTGLTAMLNTVLAFNKTMTHYDWRPRRSIIFAAWGAGEFGNIGSGEWVEENSELLRQGGVAYVNIDGCTSGDVFDGQASPALKSSVIEALKSTPYTKMNRYDPYPENKDEDTKEKEILDSESTYYDYWKRKLLPQQGQRHDHKHFIQDLVGDSDHVPFSFGAGIPSINLRFIDKEYNESYNDGQKPLPSYPELSFPGYHTELDRKSLYKKKDPEFHMLQVCARVLANSIRKLADSALLPHDFVAYGDALSNALKPGHYSNWIETINRNAEDLFKDDGKDEFKHVKINFKDMTHKLRKNVTDFQNEAKKWKQTFRKKVNLNNPYEVRMVNDKVMQIERTFLITAPDDWPRHKSYSFIKTKRHAIFPAPNYESCNHSCKGLTGPTLPGIATLLKHLYPYSVDSKEVINKKEVEEYKQKVDNLRNYVSKLNLMVSQATNLLKQLNEMI